MQPVKKPAQPHMLAPIAVMNTLRHTSHLVTMKSLTMPKHPPVPQLVGKHTSLAHDVTIQPTMNFLLMQKHTSGMKAKCKLLQLAQKQAKDSIPVNTTQNTQRLK